MIKNLIARCTTIALLATFSEISASQQRGGSHGPSRSLGGSTYGSGSNSNFNPNLGGSNSNGYGSSSPGSGGSNSNSGATNFSSGSSGGAGCPPKCDDYEDLFHTAVRSSGVVVTVDDRLRALREIRDNYIEQRQRLTAAFSVLATPWFATAGNVSVAQRNNVIQQARTEIEGLMQQALDATINEMRAQVANLLPYFWNVFNRSTRVVLLENDKEIVAVGEKARVELRTQTGLREVRGKNPGNVGLQYHEGQAMRQLKSIYHSKSWMYQ